MAGGRVAGGNERSAGAPTRDAERGAKARGVELVDGAVDGRGTVPTPPAPSDAGARENLRRIGEVTRRFRHAPPGRGGRLGLSKGSARSRGQRWARWAWTERAQRRASGARQSERRPR